LFFTASYSMTYLGHAPGGASRAGAPFIPLSFGTPSGESPDSRERAPRPDVVRQPLLKVHVPLAMVLIGLRVRLAAAPVHAVLVGTVVPVAPRHDDACAFGQGSDLSRRERRIVRLRCRHSSSSVTGTPRARAIFFNVGSDLMGA
jgi:hypothetical protein